MKVQGAFSKPHTHTHTHTHTSYLEYVTIINTGKLYL